MPNLFEDNQIYTGRGSLRVASIRSLKTKENTLIPGQRYKFIEKDFIEKKEKKEKKKKSENVNIILIDIEMNIFHYFYPQL